MSSESAKEYLKKFNKDREIIIFNDSSATVELAAKRLNCKPEHIAKTLSFLVNNEPILIVMAGNTKIDNHKYKEKFKAKAKMIPSNDLIDLIGHEAGGICPFGIKDNINVYLDNSLKEYDIIYPACGSANSAIKLTIKELEQLSKYNEWIDVTKIIDN